VVDASGSFIEVDGNADCRSVRVGAQWCHPDKAAMTFGLRG
jgi:hypothetical protein